jgi:hypothetical protein
MAARKTFPGLRPARERFMENVRIEADTGCFIWTAGIGTHGYGVFYAARRVQQTAHTYALTKKLGRPLRPGMEALHSCDRSACVSWDHLREGTHAENMADASQRGRSARPSLLVRECAKGHEFSVENTLWKTRHVGSNAYRVRTCRECNKDACRKYRNRRQGA